VSDSAAKSVRNPPEAGGVLLEVRSVAKRFGAATVLKNISLQIAAV
jgi:ABC-type sugar transport system ATPase subunit